VYSFQYNVSKSIYQHFKKEAHRDAKCSNQNTMEMINTRKENNTLEYCDIQK
jgi:hypothetical protein